MQEKKGFVFESETDTEVIAKLAKHVFDSDNHEGSFREIIEIVVQQLVREFCPSLEKYLQKAFFLARKIFKFPIVVRSIPKTIKGNTISLISF